jgi:hypothetical protein
MCVESVDGHGVCKRRTGDAGLPAVEKQASAIAAELADGDRARDPAGV